VVEDYLGTGLGKKREYTGIWRKEGGLRGWIEKTKNTTESSLAKHCTKTDVIRESPSLENDNAGRIYVTQKKWLT